LALEDILLARFESPHAHQLERSQHRCQRIAEFVAQHGEELVFCPVRVFGVTARTSMRGLALAKRILRTLLSGYVVEENRDMSVGRLAQPECVDVVPPAESRCLVLEAHGRASAGDISVYAKPMLLVRRSEVTHAMAHSVVQAGVLLERRIDVEEYVVDGAAVRIEKHLDRAEPDVNRLEERPVMVFAKADRFP
jgi:hypothetical protein